MPITRTNLTYLMLTILTVGIFACRKPPPCPDCNDQGVDHVDEGPPVPDLPCGGADLMSDNDNCGACGNACTLWWEGTDWEAGGCVEGACGPQWSAFCAGESSQLNTCDEFCGAGGRVCVAKGCSGLTAMLFNVGFDGNCGPSEDEGPDQTMAGPCDEQIPWMSDNEFTLMAICCCGE
ncbi:Endo-1,4-beta-xylanase A precursor [Enhygromyxa salina]|uniref:Endo-1,4-beta-xylanase A n=1 Tax=Enhygromyxa salina TaxID=215803 RepID=A0A0C2CZZ7_9BACT|nr:hypothetical protein [Enhygromyxa salina]KIG15180.1 Endo-1,4-beta-xylanase A precursor [Enhygromyxa salina]